MANQGIVTLLSPIEIEKFKGMGTATLLKPLESVYANILKQQQALYDENTAILNSGSYSVETPRHLTCLLQELAEDLIALHSIVIVVHNPLIQRHILLIDLLTEQSRLCKKYDN